MLLLLLLSGGVLLLLLPFLRSAARQYRWQRYQEKYPHAVRTPNKQRGKKRHSGSWSPAAASGAGSRAGGSSLSFAVDGIVLMEHSGATADAVFHCDWLAVEWQLGSGAATPDGNGGARTNGVA